MTTTAPDPTATIDVNVRIPGPIHDLPFDIHLPRAPGPVPVVVTRTAYGKRNHLDEGQAWTRRGYAYVVQDIRGRYEAAGTWRPYEGERADGAGLLDWIGEQPWAGEVILLGGSYNAYCAWAAAVTRPNLVAAVVSLAPALGFDRVKFDPCGVLRLDEHLHWWLDRAEGRVDRPGLAAAVSAYDPSWLAHLPVLDLATRHGGHLDGWREVVEAGPQPGSEAVTAEELAALGCDSLHVCGWYDLVARDAIWLWDRLRESEGGGTHRLLLGPWDHDLTLTATSAPLVFEPKPFDLGGEITGWLRERDHDATSSEAHYVPIGSSDRVRSTAWPPTGGVTQERWLSEAGLIEDGRPGGAATVELHDNPNRPRPSVVAGWDRQALDGRDDVLSWRTRPLDAPLQMAGTARVHLRVASSTTSADWVVHLLLELPDGSVAEVASGTAVTTASEADVVVELAPCAVRIADGWRLRVDVAGTDFPRLARNPGVGADRYTASTLLPSRRLVHLPARLDLPVLNGRPG